MLFLRFRIFRIIAGALSTVEYSRLLPEHSVHWKIPDLCRSTQYSGIFRVIAGAVNTEEYSGLMLEHSTKYSGIFRIIVEALRLPVGLENVRKPD